MLLSSNRPNRLLPLCQNNTIRHINCSENHVWRLSTYIRIPTDQSPATCICITVVPSVQRFSPSSGFPKTLPNNPQSRATCPRPPLQAHHPRTINPSSTMPSKLTRRRPRKISAPIRFSTNSRTVILQMPSSAYFMNKFPGSTLPVAPTIN